MATATTDIEDIRRQMAQIRRDLHVDMQAVVAGAEAATDWRYYVRLYPWAALGVAFTIGFLIVPRKRRSIRETAEKAAEEAVSKAEAGRPRLRLPSIVLPKVKTAEAEEKTKAKSGIVGALLGMIVPVAMKAAQGYATKFVENWIAEQGVLGPVPEAGKPAATPPSHGPTKPVVPPRPF